MPVLLESTQTERCHLSPLSWEPDMGSFQRAQGAHLLPWPSCQESRPRQENPAPVKDTARCKRPPCCQEACCVWVRGIKASMRFGKEKTWFSGCWRMICNWNSQGKQCFVLVNIAAPGQRWEHPGCSVWWRGSSSAHFRGICGTPACFCFLY